MIKVTDRYYMQAQMSGYQIMEMKDEVKYDKETPKGGIPKGDEHLYKEISRESVLSPMGYYPYDLLSGIKAILRFELHEENNTVELNEVVDRLENLWRGMEDE